MMNRYSCALILCGVLLGQPAAAQAPDPAGRVDAVFAPFKAAEGPGCAVGVSDAGRVVFAKGYGSADLTWRRPITPETMFDVASVSKQFTAYAVVLLAERGALSLDDDVRKHLPDLPDLGARITLANLLEHTSGLPSYDTIATVVGRPTRGGMDAELAYGLVKKVRALDFAPGTDFSYSNTNYLLLARVAERVGGKPLDTLLQAEAFGPAGMTATRYAPDLSAPIPGRATGYTPRPGGGFQAGPAAGSDGGARGVQSNVRDLLAWAAAVDGGRLNAAVQRRMTTPRPLAGDTEPMRYGAGLDVERLNGRWAVRHAGSDWRGYTGELLRLPERRLGVAVLCNRLDARADELAELTAAAWLGEVVESRPARALSAAQRAAAGRYVTDDGRTLELRVEGERATARPLAAAPLIPIDDRSFGFGLASRGARLTVENGSEPALLMAPPVGRPLRYRRYQPAAPGPEALTEYAGRYLNREFDALLPFTVKDGALVVTDTDGAARVLAPTLRDGFVLGGNTGFRFERDARGRVTRLVVAQARARRLVFERISED